MKIIFAQGNPGTQYTHSRHNVGFDMLDRLAKAWNIKFVKKPKFQSDVAEHVFDGEKILLVKPTTFYNETGQAARHLVDFYKVNIASGFLVIHDDLALPFGTLRTRARGSDAGNNGIKSLNAHLGSDYLRIRIGIYSEKRDQMHDADFVLSLFTKEEEVSLIAIYQKVEPFVEAFIENRFDPTKVSIDQAEL
jgi:PTH1 family peptidyl-tRNA hydrolase